jgi:hypothetical protein
MKMLFRIFVQSAVFLSERVFIRPSFIVKVLLAGRVCMAANISTLIILSCCLAGARTVPSEPRIPVRTGHLFVGTEKLASNRVVWFKGEGPEVAGLPAFQQTEDYLASFRILKQQLQQQQVAVSAAQRYFDIAFARYCTGFDTYLHVFTAQTSLLSTQQTTIPVRIQQMTSGEIGAFLLDKVSQGWACFL